MGTPVLIGFKIYSSLLFGTKLTPYNVHNVSDKMSHLCIRLSQLHVFCLLVYFPRTSHFFFFSSHVHLGILGHPQRNWYFYPSDNFFFFLRNIHPTNIKLA